MPRLGHTALALFRLFQVRVTAGVVGVIVNPRGEILIVEHVFHPTYPWGLPGGWLGVGESPAECLKREVREETGIEARIEYPLLIARGYYHPRHLDIAFVCTAHEDNVQLSDELLNFRWAALDGLPPLNPFHREAVAAYQARGVGDDEAELC